MESIPKTRNNSVKNLQNLKKGPDKQAKTNSTASNEKKDDAPVIRIFIGSMMAEIDQHG